jgi:dTDP-4-dehydrorhamnose 3,5-epimerase
VKLHSRDHNWMPENIVLITVEKTKLEGLLIVEPQVFGDDRGFFMETFNVRDAGKSGIPTTFAQDNHSRSGYGVLRGLHYQYPQWQGKLVRALIGEIYDVAVDIRPGSPTYGEWYGLTLSEENKLQLYVPPGFAHGFCVTSESADVAYKATTFYDPSSDASILWNDPDIGIEWPVQNPILSDKDISAPQLKDLDTTGFDVNLAS